MLKRCFFKHWTKCLKNYKGAFNNYMDQILTNFDPLSPRVDKHGHLPTLYLTFLCNEW